MNDYIAIGEFVKPHGIFGELLAVPYNCETEVFSLKIPLFFRDGSKYLELKADNIRSVNKGILIKLPFANSIDEAFRYRKMPIFVKKADLCLGESEYLFLDLIDLKCFNKRGENIGNVSGIYAGEVDILEISSSNGNFFIPMTDDNILKIDIAKRTAVVANEEKYKLW